jgi:hypothetical protein
MYHGTVLSHFERYLKMEKKFLYYLDGDTTNNCLRISNIGKDEQGTSWCLMPSGWNVDKRTIPDFDRYAVDAYGNAYCKASKKAGSYRSGRLLARSDVMLACMLVNRGSI